MKTYVLAISMVMLIGCASSGPKIDAPRLAEIRKGETTVDQVVAQFGRPNVLSKNMDGTQTAAYVYVEGRSDAGAFVPMLSALAGKADADVDSVIFHFDRKGVLRDYKTTQAKPRQAAPATANTVAAPAGETPSQANTARAPQSDKMRAAPDPSPWTIQLYPSGYRENR
jgi:outer membrane protein assembly factor BamE (lipoprotein component of BamABCDE complex)